MAPTRWRLATEAHFRHAPACALTEIESLAVVVQLRHVALGASALPANGQRAKGRPQGQPTELVDGAGLPFASKAEDRAGDVIAHRAPGSCVGTSPPPSRIAVATTRASIANSLSRSTAGSHASILVAPGSTPPCQ